MKWSKVVIQVGESPVTVYVREDNARAVVFPPFGKLYGIHSDTSAIDLVTSLLFHTPNRVFGYSQYISSQEDTAVIHQEVA